VSQSSGDDKICKLIGLKTNEAKEEKSVL